MDKARNVSAKIAGGAAAAVAIVGLALGGSVSGITRIPQDLPTWLVAFGLAGIPVGALFGWLLGPTVVAAGPWEARVIAVGTALLAVPVGATVLVLSWSAAALVDRPVHVVDLLTGVLGLAFFGSLVIGPIVILVTLPAAVAWVAILRRRVRGRERSPS